MSRAIGRWRGAMLLAAGGLALCAPAAGAQGENLGGGVVDGSIEFEEPVRLGDACRSTDFTFSGESQSAVVNTVIAAHVGPVEISGSGRDNCPSGAFQAGTVILTATGTGPTGSRLECPALVGSYTRVVSAATVAVDGTCTVNGFPAQITFVSEVAVVPEPGLTFQAARFVGPFTVFPDALDP